ncbi:trihelix transcription [Lasius niger]|uniref:Trihelix transcription n=1 Tax=Lasius niger TaxID=67767 RepID=A0A0J7JWM8_LASNI|nr:trihelix transcription [Lasius niger]
MQKNGYLVTYGRKAADKCHQRWRNLEKVYRGHCRYMKSTGTGKKKPPKYFEEMHEIIGEKHSSHPVHLLDSLHDSDTAASEIYSIEAKSNEVIDNIEDSPDMGDDESENIIKKKDYNLKKANIFENVKKSVRPKTDVRTVLKELHDHKI